MAPTTNKPSPLTSPATSRRSAAPPNRSGPSNWGAASFGYRASARHPALVPPAVIRRERVACSDGMFVPPGWGARTVLRLSTPPPAPQDDVAVLAAPRGRAARSDEQGRPLGFWAWQ